jgi:phage gpG-like protein
MATSNVVDITELLDVLADMEERAGDLSEPMAIIAEDLVSRVNDKFESGGPGWPALADSTIAKRRKKGRGAQILKDTGRLAASIEADHGSDFAEAATDVEYAVYHVSDEPREKIPKRDFLDVLDDGATDYVVETITAYLTGEM